MSKRRAEDTLLHDISFKRCYRSLCSLDTQFESMASVGGVNPPSLLALLGSRCRKRPHYFEDPVQGQDMPHNRKIANSDLRNPAVDALATKTSGSFKERRTPTTISSCKKRPREECVASQTDIPSGDKRKDGAADDGNSDQSTFNSFQFWRVPLPELDLSLLEDADKQSGPRGQLNVKKSNSDAMET